MTGSWGFYARVKDDRFSSYADPGIRGIRAQRNIPIPRNARAPVRARRTVFTIRARLPYFASPKHACRRDDLDPLLFVVVPRNTTIFRVFFYFYLLTFVWRRQCVSHADTVYGITQWIGCRKNNIRDI